MSISIGWIMQAMAPLARVPPFAPDEPTVDRTWPWALLAVIALLVAAAVGGLRYGFGARRGRQPPQASDV